MKWTFILLFLVALTCVGKESVLQSGDLLFVAEGQSDFSNAISESTRSDSLSFVHVAMVYVNDCNVNVIEAAPENGVTIRPLDEFLASCPTVESKPAVVAKRLDVDYPVMDAISNALSHLGEPYDWYFMPDNGRMYCSELIFESYLTSVGEHIFNTVPMNFKTSDGSIPAFWLELFTTLGIDVPQGIPGTNPNQISKDNRLIEIIRFF